MSSPTQSSSGEQLAATNSHADAAEERPAGAAHVDSRLHDELPPLAQDVSFWGMAATQFLGAFNDNVYKQLILLLATPTVAQLEAGTGEDLQSEAQYVFAAAFLIFSGYAGYLSDRYSKRPIVILSKVAEIAAMILGVIGFLLYGYIGITGIFVVLFLMGTQSAFFGPSKYGILPEMIRGADLPRANGIFLMLTFLAIIFGMATAGALMLWLGQRIWLASLACVGIAITGTATSFLVRPVPAAQPDSKFHWSCFLVPRNTLKMLWRDRQLLAAMIVVAVFWMVGGIVLQTVNALGKSQLGLNDLRTSMLSAAIGVGTAIGCILGGHLSCDRINRTVVTTGAVGTVVMLFAMSLPGPVHGHLLGFWGSIPVLALLGTASGMMIVPVQVALQSRPPKEEKGRTIATMNQISWIGVILGAIVYMLSIDVLDVTGWPRATIFAVTAVLMLPVAIFYRPKDEQLSDTDPSKPLTA